MQDTSSVVGGDNKLSSTLPLQVLANEQGAHQATHHRPPHVYLSHSILQPDLSLRLLALSPGPEPEPGQVPLLRQPEVRLHLAGQPAHHALGVQSLKDAAPAGSLEADSGGVRWGHVRWSVAAFLHSHGRRGRGRKGQVVPGGVGCLC